MKKRFGVSMDEDLVEGIEGDLDFGDTRSSRLEELVEMGLAVEEAAEQIDLELPESNRAKRSLIRQAFIDSDL